MKDFEISKKTDILLDALKERYQSMHKIRDRVQNIGIWALGIMFAVSGWLLKGDINLNFGQKIGYIFAIVIAFYAIRFLYLRDLCTGFKNQQKVTAKIEKALGLFEEGYFIENETMYPESWKNSGCENGDGKFFETTYVLLYIGIFFLIASVLFNGGTFCVFSEPHYFHYLKTNR